MHLGRPISWLSRLCVAACRNGRGGRRSISLGRATSVPTNVLPLAGAVLHEAGATVVVSTARRSLFPAASDHCCNQHMAP